MSSVRFDTTPTHVARLTLARPERKNAFDAALVAELTALVGKIDPATRAVVLASEGDAFCAGADIGWLRGVADFTLAENMTDSRALGAMFRALYELDMPLVARVQGAAIGGGAGLVAVADIAVVSPYVVRRIGVARATALFVTGSRIDAKRAHEIGLVERLVEPADLDAAVERVVAAILEGGPEAVRSAKRLAREVAGRPPDEVAEGLVERIARARVSDEGQEGMRAFLERRKPSW